jgi:hypothetical protein
MRIEAVVQMVCTSAIRAAKAVISEAPFGPEGDCRSRK